MDRQIEKFNDLQAKYKKVHFIGIGGAGMAPLAHLTLEIGCVVSGSDAAPGAKLEGLAKAGAAVFVGHKAEQLSEDVVLVVVSSAINDENPELALARSRGVEILRRGEFLALLSGSFERCVAIGGTHGKTSVSAMLSFLLCQCGVDCGFMIGGAVKDFPSFRLGNGDIFVTEVDESDGTIGCIAPAFGVLNNAEDDHAWSVGGVENLRRTYQKFILQSNNFVCFNDQNILDLMPEEHENNLIIIPDNALACEKFVGFQERNSRMVIALAMLLGVEPEMAVAALSEFPGVKRRMTLHLETEELVIIEDYAHHPTELNCALDYLDKRYPDRVKYVIFQPHRVERLKRYFDEFVKIFSQVDNVIISEVFAAWRQDCGCSGQDLAERISEFNENVIWGGSDWRQMAELTLQKVAQSDEKALVAVIGAGDIDEIIPYLCRVEK